MTKPLVKIAPVLMTMTLLTGCGGTAQTGFDTVHQPVVSRTDYTFDLQTIVGGDLASGEARRLSDWFDSMGVSYGDRISIDDPSSYNGNGRDAVASVAAQRGLLLNETAPVTVGAIPEGRIRVVVSRVEAEVPGCPDWTRSSQPEFEASSMSNFGCATNSNLAAMVADPEDLIRGREGSTDQYVSTKAIRTYRNKPATGAGEMKNESSRGQ